MNVPGRSALTLVLVSMLSLAGASGAVAQDGGDCSVAENTTGGPATVHGTPRDDLINTVDDDVDIIFAGPGNDSICAGPGDIVYGGPGHDTVDAVGAAEVHGEAGNDFLTSLTFGIVSGGPGSDTLIDGGTASLFGGPGPDVLALGAFCDGGPGKDEVLVADDGSLTCASIVNVP